MDTKSVSTLALVTGATGFVGWHLVHELLTRGYAVRALVRDPDKGTDLRARGVETVVGDLREVDSLRQAAKGATLVFHCAAAHSTCSKQEIQETNFAGVRNVLEAARQEKIGRLILMSSANVYGSRSFQRATEETETRRSNEVHADLKLQSDDLALEYVQQCGLDVSILRPGLIYGPGDHHLPRIGAAIRRGKFMFIGSRKNIVPLVYIDDMVRVMLLAAEAPSARGRIYNVTDASHATIGELTDRLADLLNCPGPTRVLPYWLAWSVCALFDPLGRSGPINRTTLRFLGTSRFVDCQRAQDELGYQPEFDLRRGLDCSLDWIDYSSGNDKGND